jgi:PAS domain S-box-containing protein
MPAFTPISAQEAIFLQNPDPMVRLTLTGEVIDANPASLAWMHKAYDEVVGKSLFVSVGKGTADVLQSVLQKLIETVKPQHVGLTTGSVLLSPIFHNGGQLSEVLIVLRDFDSEQTKLELTSLTERRAIHPRDVLFTLGEEGKFISFHPMFSKITGWDSAPLLGKSYFDLLADEDKMPAKTASTIVWTEAKTATYEAQFFNKDGTRFYGQFWVAPLLENGKVIGQMVVVQDISDRKRLELNLQKQAKRLEVVHEIDKGILAARSAEEIADVVLGRLGALMPAFHAAVLLIDHDNKKITTLTTTFAFPELDNSESDFALYGDVAVAFQQLERENTLYVPDLPAVENRPPIQEIMWRYGVNAYMVLPMLAREELVGVLYVGADKINAYQAEHFAIAQELADQLAVAIQNARLVKELKQALVQEQMARKQLVQAGKLAAMGRIVASVAHEMNNPLQAIQNTLFLLQSENKLGEQGQTDLELAMTEINRIGRLVEQLRETYRPVAEDAFKMVDVNSLVAEVVKLLEVHAKRQKVKLTVNLASGLPQMPAIADQIKQVLLNIALNGIEAMENGGDLIIQTNVFNNIVQLSISDTGIGIDRAKLKTIFDPFFTTKTTGTGLGLAICYDIVERHQGKIEVDSNFGKGTIVNILLPLIRK